MSNKFPPTPLPYLFKGKPLQSMRKNNYSKSEKIEIVIKINNEYKAGLLPLSKLIWIWVNERFGKFTAEMLIDDMLEKGIIKLNPITMDKRTFRKPKTIFDW